MIHPSDTRVGNLVQWNGSIWPISLNDFTEEFEMKKAFSRMDGIPLTEEWLVRMGFEESEEVPFILKVSDFCYICIDLEEDKFWVCHYDIDIKFVHQLQNLYYCLTGNELEVK